MGDDVEPYRHVLLMTLEQAHAVGYSGYSKFDGLLSPVTQTLSLGWWPLRLAWTQLVMRAPLNCGPGYECGRVSTRKGQRSLPMPTWLVWKWACPAPLLHVPSNVWIGL